MSGCAVVPTLRACCFFFPLRWSALAIASLYLVLSVLLTYVFATPIVLHKWFETNMENSTLFFFFLIVISMVFQLITGVILIVATIRESPEWMWLWICVSFFQSAGLVVTAAACTLVYMYQVRTGEIQDDPEEALTYAAYASYGLVLYYATSVVNGYKKKLYAEKAARSNIVQAEMAPLSSV